MRCSVLFCCVGLVYAQAGGTEPKPDALQYEVHGRAGDTAIGAEYLIHSVSGQGRTFFVDDYLVVEVALFPPKGGKVRAGAGVFALRVNCRKPVAPATPGMVANSLRHPDWQTGPRVEGGIGAGPADVIFGRPRTTTYPGGQQPRLPTPPRAPEPDPPGGIQKEPPVKAEELVVRAALPEGDFAGPVSGFLYFPYRGKASGIKSVDLVWGDTVLKMR